MHPDIERLRRLVPPPESPVENDALSVSWDVVKESLGTALPQDYKELVGLYGVGWFADWICVFSPFSERMPLDNPERLKGLLQGQAEFPQYQHPFPAYPAPGGLLPWGQDDNAGLFCWRTVGVPDEWTIVNLDNHYSAAYRELTIGTVGLLAGWFDGSITGDWYPEDVLPTEQKTFTVAGQRP